MMSATEIFTLILSIIGACAWLPEIWKLFVFSHSKIEATVIDVIHIKGFKLGTTKKGEIHKKGELVILAVDFFNYYKSLFIQNFEIEITLNRGDKTARKAVIGNRVNYNHNGVPMSLELPLESNIFVNPLFISGENNIRIIPCLLENVDSEDITMYDIKEIKFTYRDRGLFQRKRTVKIKCDAERFSKPNYIKQFAEKITKEE